MVSFYGAEKEYFLKFNSIEMTINCSCSKFEMIGILCRHTLKVLNRMNIMQIPDKYMLKRWTQDVRDSLIEFTSTVTVEDDPKLLAASQYRQLCPQLVQLVARCSTNQMAF